MMMKKCLTIMLLAVSMTSFAQQQYAHPGILLLSSQ